MSAANVANKLPRSMRIFEALTVLSIVVGFAHLLAVDAGARTAGLLASVFAIALTFAISRGRQNWARWIWLVMSIVDLAAKILDLKATLAIGYPAVTILVVILQLAGLAFLFTPTAEAWFRTKAPEDTAS